MLEIIKQAVLKCINRKKCLIGKKTKITKGCFFEGTNRIGKGAVIVDSHLGMFSYCADDIVLLNTYVGRFCSIASGVRIVRGTHPTKEFVSTHPAFFSIRRQCGVTFVNENTFKEFSYVDENEKYNVIIGNDVWIGENALILEGVTIGNGAIIAAGAVVCEDIPDYAIACGVPAKIKRYRFSEKEIERLLEIKWWDKSIDWIKHNAQLFMHIDNFLKEVE